MQKNLISNLDLHETKTNDSNLGIVVTEIYKRIGRDFYYGSFTIFSSESEELNRYLDSIPFFKLYTKKEILEPLGGQVYPINLFQSKIDNSDSKGIIYTAQDIAIPEIPLSSGIENFGIMLVNKENLTAWANKSKALSPLINVKADRFDYNFSR
jgi:hypothetical protein